MQKKNFVSMILGTIGGILFALGMCMCLLPEWGAFNQGVVVAVIGAVVLLAMVILRRRMEGKPAIHRRGKPLEPRCWASLERLYWELACA